MQVRVGAILSVGAAAAAGIEGDARASVSNGMERGRTDDDGGKDNDHLRERANARERLTRRDGRYGIVHQRREERPLRDAWIMS